MQPFSSRQLYIMNGGNKIYIYKDGFGDVYRATPAEEAEWTLEVMTASLAKIETSENSIELNNAMENLRFHSCKDLDALLLSKMEDANPARRKAFATALRNKDLPTTILEATCHDFVQHRDGNTNDMFLRDFKNPASRSFILTCVECYDDELFIKATITLGRWACSGLPALRQDRLLEILQPENRHLPSFKPAVEQLRSIFHFNGM